MKTGYTPQASTITAVPLKRFGALIFVPLLVVAALLLLFWHISPIASLAQTPETPTAIRYAAPTGSGSECSQANPCALQTAVTFATNGDEIYVLEGIYTNSPGQPTLSITRNVTIIGGFPSDWSAPDPVLHPSILESDGSTRVVHHFGGATAVLDGFRIHNGADVSLGGGIYVETGSLTVDHSWIYDNVATSAGGGIAINSGAIGVIRNSEIYNNSSPSGGGIHVYFTGAHAYILFNNIRDNTTTGINGSGGGVYVNNNSTAFLEGNHIHHNTAVLGGGMYIPGNGEATAQNNMIYANNATTGGGGFQVFGVLESWHNTVVGNSTGTSGGGGFNIGGATANVQISNTIVASNTSSAGFTGINHTGGTATGDYVNLFNNTSNVSFPNTITEDPEFINYAGFLNLHLAEGSPNFDAGNSTVTQDIDRQVRPNPDTNIADIGADEFYPNIPAFSFTPLFTQEFVDRGTVASYEHLLINENTTEPDIYTFTCVNDLGWGVLCPEPQTVPVGQFVNVTTQITVPGSATALQAANTIITATSTVSEELSHAVLVRSIVSPIPGIQFTPNYSITNPPGEIITLTHTLTNTGDAPDTIQVTIVGDTLGWAELIPQDPLAIPLGIGASVDVQVRVTIPPQAAGIIPNITTIRATSQYDTAVYAEVVDTIRAEETAGTRYVRSGGNDTNNNCTVATSPCATVPHAIGQAVTNDEVRIAFSPGPYNVTAATEINETLYVSGNWNSNFTEQIEEQQTIIQQTGPFQIFILSGSSNNSTFDSLILRNGANSASRGGAVSVGFGVQANFSNITFENNQAERGGALNVWNGGLAIIERSRFNDNTASFQGGAVHVEGGTLALRQSAFNNNAVTGSAAGSGGGAVFVLNGLLIVENTLLNENTAVTNGGALFVQSSNTSVNFATIVNNSATNGGGIYSNNGGGQPFQLHNSILADNTAVTGGGALHAAAGSITGEFVNFFNNTPANVGTINITDLFNDPPDFVPGDPEFHLLADSAMVDARGRNEGDPTNQLAQDFEEDNRPADEGYDLGYDELAGCAAKRDGTVFGSIQAALEMENPQSNLILVSGICRGVNEIDVGGQTIFQTVHITGTTEITIQGGWTGDFEDRLIAETTIIDPQAMGRAFYFNGPVSVTLEYLTIRNGDATGLGGGPSGQDAGGQIYNTAGQVRLNAVTMLNGTAVHGAAYYQDSGNLSTDLLVATTDNFDPPDNNDDLPLRGRVQDGAATNGGAFHINGGVATINATEIMSNTAVNGGALYHAGGVLTTTNNVIAFNNVTGDGGGVFHNGPDPAQLLHNTFYQNNAASDGGGVYRQSGSGALAIRSNIFQDNDALSGDAINAPSGTVEDYNYFYGQPAALAGGISPGGNSNNQGTGGTPPGLLDPDNGNFHLSNTAPGTDNGDPASPVSGDFDGDLRPSNQGPDMGADEVAGCRVELNGVIYGSIQEALNNAQTGDVIKVSGICSGVHEYDTGGPAGGCRGDDGIIFTTVHIDQNVILQGGWDDDFQTQGEEITILDATGLGRVIHIAPGVTATVEGFHIVNGALDGVNGNGAGICIDNASPTIRHNHITTHTATNGAAIYSINSAALIDGNRIYNSHADALALANGGGIYATSNNGTAVSIVNNFIYDNSANTNGGGFYNASGNHLFWHNTVVANTANNLGAGAYVAAGAPQFRSAIFLDNDAPSTDGVHGNAGSAPTITFSDFFGQDVDLGGTAVTGAADNLFVDPQLTPGYTLTLNSPMLDAGDPALTLDHDFEDHLRPSHLGFDIGADEIAGCVARNLAAPDVIYGSLQRAVDEAADGDTIEVDGVCLNARLHPNSGGSVQNLFVDKPLTIDGDWNSGLVPDGHLTATLNALDNGRVLYVAAGGALTLTNIILINGEANGAGLSNHGGGVYNADTLWLDSVEVLANFATNGGGVYNTGNLTAHRSIIQANSATQGGGVYNNGGTAVFSELNHIANNDVSGSGGGVHQASGNLTLDGNRIYENLTPSGNGGGVYLAGGMVVVRNNFIYENSAQQGGGLYNANTNTPIWHNTFYLNAATGGGQNGGGIFSATSQPVLIRSNIVHANQGSGIHVTGQASPDIDYNNVVDNLANGSPANYTGNASAGPNDISVPPNYVSAITGNLHLRSWSAGVDDADPAVPFNHDIDGDVRPTNGGPDRGADEINSCLIRVIDPTDPDPDTREHIFGVLQFAIDFAEDFAPGPFPTVEIARGECTGVRQDSETGTWQVGIVREDLDFAGSLQRSNFQYVGDYTSDDVGTLTTRINADYEGRVIYVHEDADPTFTHIAFVNGNAAAAGGGLNGGAILVPDNGSVQLYTTYVCESAASNGGGIYFGGSSGAVRENYITGSTIGECIPAHVEENESGGIILVVPLLYEGNSASSSGGGLYNSGPLGITDVAFYVNEAGVNGGGIANTATDLRIINGLFYSNTAVSNGGAIFNTGPNLEAYHTTITENSAQTGQGGGIRTESTGFILNSTILDSNVASSESGLSMPGGLNPILAYNNIWNNTLPPGVTNTNPVNGDPDLRGFYPVFPPINSPVIDQADPALLDPGVPEPGGGFYPIDFDARLVERPDGGTEHLGTRASDVGAIEWWKDFGCTVTPTPQQQTAAPDSAVVYNFLVTNTGYPYPPSDFRHGFIDTIVISLTTSAGWGSLEGGPVQTFVDMDWNESRPITLTVDVPADAQNGQSDISTIHCQSQSRPDRVNEGRATTFVGLVSGVIVYPAYTASAQPGDVLTFNHTVENIGNDTHTFNILPSAGIRHASAVLLENGVPVSQTQATLARNQTRDVLLEVTILETALRDEVANPGVVAIQVDDPQNTGAVQDDILILGEPGPRYVAPGGRDIENNCRVSAIPCGTIQHAIYAAEPGDDIFVAQGTYTDFSSEPIGGETFTQNVIISKSVNIYGGYSTLDGFAAQYPITQTTRLDGEGIRRVMVITPGITVTLSGLFIENGNAAAQAGAPLYGGGVYNVDSSLTVTATFFLDNAASLGGGLYQSGGQLAVNGSVFAGNGDAATSSNAGGGIYLEGVTAVLENNTFVGNETGSGGAVYVGDGAALAALNNIFSENAATTTPGSAVFITTTAAITEDYSLYWLNDTNFVTGTNSLTAEPDFLDQYFHLSAASPAKDAGTELTSRDWGVDYDMQPRIMGPTIDIGADERLQVPSFTLLPVTATAVITAAEPYTYEHVLTNTGDVTDTYSLTLFNEEITPGGNWTVTMTPMTNTGLLDTNESVTITLVISGDVPGAILRSLITATSDNYPLTASATDTTTVRFDPGVDIAANESGTTAPNVPIVYSHTLTNTGSGIDRFALSVFAENPAGWAIGIMPTETAFLPAGETMTFTVSVTPPPGTPPDVSHTVQVEARSLNTLGIVVTDTLTDTTTVLEAAGLLLLPMTQTQTIPDDSTAVYFHTLQNTGNVTTTADLAISGVPAGWPVTVAPTSVNLTPAQTVPVTVTVVAPPGSGGLTHVAHVTATATVDPAVQATAVDTTTVLIQAGVIIEPDNLIITEPNTIVTFTHTVTNIGNGAETFDLSFVNTLTWTTTVIPDAVTLDVGESAEVQVEVVVPPDAVPDVPNFTTVTARSSSDPAVFDTAVDETRIRQTHSLILIPDQSGLADPGTTINYSHWLTNTGNGTDEIVITAVTENSWPTTPPAGTIILPPGAGTELTVALEVPIGAAGRTEIMTVTAASIISPTATAQAIDTTIVTGEVGVLGVEIAPDRAASGNPGDTLIYLHTVTNTGDIAEQFLLSVTSANGWAAGVSPSSIILSPGEAASVQVTTTIPLTATGGSSDVATVLARSQTDADVFDTAEDTTTVLGEPGYGVIIEPDNTGTANAGDTVAYTHWVTNTGSFTDTFNLTTESSHGWPTPDPLPVTLASGESTQITVTLIIPAAVFTTTDVMTVTAVSINDPTVTDNAINTTFVNGVSGTLGVLLEPDNAATATPGATVQYIHQLTNTGTITDDYVVTAVSSQGWTVVIVPASGTIIRLTPGQSANVVVRVTVPGTATGGTVDVTTVTAVSLSDSNVQDIARDITTVQEDETPPTIYLPIILRPGGTPPPPPTPTPTSTPVTPTPTATPCAPPTNIDLIVTQIQVVPAAPISGQPATVYVTIRNQGSQNVPFGNNFFLDFYVDRVPQPYLVGDIAWGIQGADLTAGTSRTYEAAYIFGGGAHQLWAQVDTDRHVNECPNEHNNTFGPVNINVSGAVIEGLSIQPQYGPRQTPEPVMSTGTPQFEPRPTQPPIATPTLPSFTPTPTPPEATPSLSPPDSEEALPTATPTATATPD
ncbi:MAG: right-handed parallel beta-helix repeat-containing protein [Anaerolineae bacterium]|nr:right-handed parallel beta-helix repeat-containing protein [Anaerolineae bacterium]